MNEFVNLAAADDSLRRRRRGEVDFSKAFTTLGKPIMVVKFNFLRD